MKKKTNRINIFAHSEFCHIFCFCRRNDDIGFEWEEMFRDFSSFSSSVSREKSETYVPPFVSWLENMKLWEGITGEWMFERMQTIENELCDFSVCRMLNNISIFMKCSHCVNVIESFEHETLSAEHRNRIVRIGFDFQWFQMFSNDFVLKTESGFHNVTNLFEFELLFQVVTRIWIEQQSIGVACIQHLVKIGKLLAHLIDISSSSIRPIDCRQSAWAGSSIVTLSAINIDGSNLNTFKYCILCAVCSATVQQIHSFWCSFTRCPNSLALLQNSCN